MACGGCATCWGRILLVLADHENCASTPRHFIWSTDKYVLARGRCATCGERNLRVLADMENLRERSAKAAQSTKQYAIQVRRGVGTSSCRAPAPLWQPLAACSAGWAASYSSRAWFSKELDAFAQKTVLLMLMLLFT